MKYWHWIIYAALILAGAAGFSVVYCGHLVDGREAITAYCGVGTPEVPSYSDCLIQIAGRLEVIASIAAQYGYEGETLFMGEVNSSRSAPADQLYRIYAALLEQETLAQEHLQSMGKEVTTVHKKTAADKHREILSWTQEISLNPYNGLAAAYNNELNRFPAVMYAKLLKIDPLPLFG